ncbi:MAG: hypothetical protein JW973_03675 [Bacteroidales bacterium]|nr:hypothetical protein [Bacteroidales bacterium]
MNKSKMHWFLSSFLLIAVSVTAIIVWKLKDSKEVVEPGFDKPDEFMNYFHAITTPIGGKSSGYKTNYRFYELDRAKGNLKRLKSTAEKYPWVQRGPGNVGGRTRSVIIDFDDPTFKTWYAAAVSGGIWKTTDEGETWTNMTPDLPNLATNTMAMAPSNHNTIYAGTGEGYGGVGMVTGNGIIKSTNRGVTWQLLNTTTLNDNFRFVNKILIDPDNENVVLAATNRGIFKSADGGQHWQAVYEKGYAMQDLLADPTDFLRQYAGAYGYGILKSEDGGDTWIPCNTGIGEGGRFSLSISPQSPNRIYSCVEAVGYESGIAELETHIYISSDYGLNWAKYVSSVNFLGSQGWFNNVITVHPFNENLVYVGGVDLGQIEFLPGTSVSDPVVKRVDTIGTASYMDFINFGGRFLGGGMSTGDLEDGTDILSGDWVPVEIRFGPGKQQKAHRFTVPEGEGPGVPPEDYSYMDYINVPFEAWDVKNNRQLMLSFRDQERDGDFNLIERSLTEEISGREYFFVHAVTYNASAASSYIAKAGGYTYKQLYFFWPTLAEDATWTPASLPESVISIEYGSFILHNQGNVTVLADSRKNSNLHVDHHEIHTIVTDAVNEKFTLLDANDGGLGISFNEGSTWEQLDNGYITTQFYGVAKKPWANEYIGGMQDNGTWQSPAGLEATSISEYNDRIGGDGFEVLWHPLYPHRILGSTYYNQFYVTNDGGNNWTRADQGINGDGPFVSRLSHSRAKPDVVFAVGSKGVFRHNNFGMGRYFWNTIPIGKGWTVNETVTNQHNVEVSLASPSVIWAGAGMFANPDLHLFLSRNGGNSFDSVPNVKDVELGYISGIATHPHDTGTAYALFSLKGKPKILRTTDYGKNWEDISGFGTGNSSVNGFPDVMVYSVLVMPYTGIIWAGTEIGLFESTDDGLSWHYADNGLPAVSIWQMDIVNQQVIVATHGRGIWTLDLTLVGMQEKAEEARPKLSFYPNPSREYVNVLLDNPYRGMMELTVTDMNGKAIMKTAHNKADQVWRLVMDIRVLKPANYIVTAKCGSSLAIGKITVY